MDDQKLVELMDKMVNFIETKNKPSDDESSFRMKAGTVIAVVALCAVLLGGWLGTIQMVQAGHSESIGSLKASQDKTDQQYNHIMAAVKRLEDLQMGKVK